MTYAVEFYNENDDFFKTTFNVEKENDLKDLERQIQDYKINSLSMDKLHWFSKIDERLTASLNRETPFKHEKKTNN